MSKTIRRNSSKMLRNIFDSVKTVKVYTLSNNFSGEAVDAGDWLEEEYNRMTRTRLTLDENGIYSMDIHSNCWYTFSI